MVELLNVTDTANRLESIGKQISRRWLHDLCNEGRGPPYQYGEQFGKAVILIDWQDALQWAETHSFVRQKPPRQVPRNLFDGITEVANASDGMEHDAMPQQPPLASDAKQQPTHHSTDIQEEQLIADILATWMRNNHLTRWHRFLSLHKGPARLARLNMITLEMLRYASKRLASKMR